MSSLCRIPISVRMVVGFVRHVRNAGQEFSRGKINIPLYYTILVVNRQEVFVLREAASYYIDSSITLTF